MPKRSRTTRSPAEHPRLLRLSPEGGSPGCDAAAEHPSYFLHVGSGFSLKALVAFINNNLIPPARNIFTQKHLQHRLQEQTSRGEIPPPGNRLLLPPPKKVPPKTQQPRLSH